VGKVVALCEFLALFIAAINCFSCLIVPYVYLVRDNRLVPRLFTTPFFR
jgi:hypothetical protein